MVVVSLRAKIDRIQLWTRGKENVEAINALGKKLIKLLDLQEEPTIGLEFQVGVKKMALRISTDPLPSTILRISPLLPSSCRSKLSILSMVEDSTGVHTLSILRISRWEAARTRRLLTMAQVRLVATRFFLPSFCYEFWDVYSPGFPQLDWMDQEGHLRGERRDNKPYNNRNELLWGGLRVLLFDRLVQGLVLYPCKFTTANESKKH